MTDQSDKTTTQVAPAPAQATAPATTEPSPITTKDLEAMEQRLVSFVKKENAQLYQGVQSKTDKFTAQMKQQMKAYESAAEKLGIQLTDADRQVLQNDARLQILSQEASQSKQSFVYQPGQAIPEGLTDDELAAGVNAAEEKLYVSNQVKIEQGDPEGAILYFAQALDDPAKYLAEVQRAIDAKKARLGITPTTAQPSPSPATSVSPGLVQGKPSSNPISNVTDFDELWKAGFGKRG